MARPQTTARWTIIIPVKVRDRAKTRLREYAASERAQLALAFALDTVVAAVSCRAVSRVVVATDDRAAALAVKEVGAEVVSGLPDAGLNGDLRFAEEVVRGQDLRTPVSALLADLPAVSPRELDAAFEAAARLSSPRWFIPDADGAGTTLLAADSGAHLLPRFGPGSARAHESDGAVPVPIPAGAGLRHDVDTRADLLTVRSLGVGRFTRAALDTLGDGSSGPSEVA